MSAFTVTSSVSANFLPASRRPHPTAPDIWGNSACLFPEDGEREFSLGTLHPFPCSLAFPFYSFRFCNSPSLDSVGWPPAKGNPPASASESFYNKCGPPHPAAFLTRHPNPCYSDTEVTLGGIYKGLVLLPAINNKRYSVSMQCPHGTLAWTLMVNPGCIPMSN